MGLGINNLMAVNLSIKLNNNIFSLNKSMQKLASGLSINWASDNPAGLVISEQMRTRIATLNQEIENVSYQINKYQTADSALMQEREKLTELRTLAVAAANEGGIDEAARDAYQAEADNIVSSYNLIRESTQFGSQYLLDGSEGSVADIAALNPLDLSSTEAAENAMNQIDQEIARVDSQMAQVGATQKHGLQSRLTNLRVESQNLIASESQIRDLDYGLEISNFIKNQLLAKSKVALFAHSTIASNLVLSLLSRD